MTDRSVLVVGSGPSGVHFAESALEAGFEVTMLDVGHSGPQVPLGGRTFNELKSELADPIDYFIGPELDALVLPSEEKEYYGFPPAKKHVFETPPGFDVQADGFEPLFSFARGGLAETWTAGCYPFNGAELENFPFDYAALEPHYSKVAARIGVSGAVDDLAQFMPVHENLLPPLDFDEHSTLISRAYEARREYLNRKYGAFVGRTRVATLSKAHDGREACSYLGRCLWGCPGEALYTPAITLRKLLALPGFTYLAGHQALFFRISESNRISAVVARNISTGDLSEIPVVRLALAAGTLGSSTLVLRSIKRATGETPVLPGLMDNRQALVPFLNLRMLGKAVPERSYQYHLLGMGLVNPVAAEYVHCQVTTLGTTLMHPIIQALPVDMVSAMKIARNTRSALGVVNVNFHDTRRANNTLSLADDREESLLIRYGPPEGESGRIRATLARVSRVLRSLGCIVPPGMVHVRPMGASVHYAGTFPMTEGAGRWRTTSGGKSLEFPNLFFADGSTFPFLPAKNLTFTLMANASRVAEQMR